MADPEGDYETSQLEMITSACHHNATGNMILQYKIDCALVYEKHKALTYMLDCCSYVQPPKCTHDRWKAFQGLYKHYLGPNNVDNLANTAE